MVKKQKKMKMLSLGIVILMILTFLSLNNTITKTANADCIDPNFGVTYKILVGNLAFVMWGDEGLPDSLFHGGCINEFIEAIKEYPNGAPQNTIIRKAKFVFYSFAIPLDVNDIHYPNDNQGYSFSPSEGIDIPLTTIDNPHGENVLAIEQTNLFNFNSQVMNNLRYYDNLVPEDTDNLYRDENYILPKNENPSSSSDFENCINDDMLISYSNRNFKDGKNYYGYTSETGVSFVNTEVDHSLIKSWDAHVCDRTGWEGDEDVSNNKKRVDGFIHILPTVEQRILIRDCVNARHAEGRGCTGCVVTFPDLDIYNIILNTEHYPSETQPYHPKCDTDDSPFSYFYVLSFKFSVSSMVFWDWDAEYTFPMPIDGPLQPNDDDGDDDDGDEEETTLRLSDISLNLPKILLLNLEKITNLLTKIMHLRGVN